VRTLLLITIAILAASLSCRYDKDNIEPNNDNPAEEEQLPPFPPKE